MLDKYLIEHCSPTLASIKTANLFGISTKTIENPDEHLEKVNKTLETKGVVVLKLKEENDRMLVYVCRKSKLAEDFAKPGVWEFMKKYGYENLDVDYAIDVLSKKLAKKEEFPHEIGMFLGYPLGDVIGFIENAGKNSKCVGCWKVYCNECVAMKTFAMFEKCRRIYKEKWQGGRDINQLTVAA